MPDCDASPGAVATDQTYTTDLKLEAAECRRHGYILAGQFLGQGAYAKVYLGHATQAKINNNLKLRSSLKPGQKELKVAIKIISVESAPNEYISKFLPREISTMNRCYKHVNVLQLYDIFATAQRVYLILEFATAGDLLTYITRCTKNTSHRVPEDSARSMFAEIAAGLRFIHNKGVAHRDLKCENVLLTNGTTIKLSDFGFAIDTSDTVGLLKTHCGSYAYASPEILRRQKYDGRMADLWSLGVVLFAMVNGGLPFKESDAKSVLAAMKKPVYFKSHLSTECKELIRELLRIKPQKRLTIDQVLCHPWVTNRHHLDHSSGMKIPSPSHSSSLLNYRPGGDLIMDEMEQRIKKQYALMDDPSNVARYLRNRRKNLTETGLPSYLGSTRGNTADNKTVANHGDNAGTLKPSEENRIQMLDVDLVPRKTKTTECFEPPCPKYKVSVKVRMDTDLAKSKLEIGDKGKLIQDTSQPNRPAVGIKAFTPPGPKRKPANIYHQRAWVTSRAESKIPMTTVGKRPVTRESASPNVINIRIDQVTEISPNAYNEFQRVPKGLKVITKCGKTETKRKCGNETNNTWKAKKSEPRSVSCKPKSSEARERTWEGAKFVYFPPRPEKTEKKTKKRREIRDFVKSITPKIKKAIDPQRLSEKSISQQEQLKPDPKLRYFSAKEDDRKVPETHRAFVSSTYNPSTVRCHATTPSNFVASQPPCKGANTFLPVRCFSPLVNAVREEIARSPEQETSAKCVKVRLFSNKFRGIEGGERTKVSRHGDSLSCGSSPTAAVWDNHLNPADALQLPSKYRQNMENNMNAQQLLSCKVKKGNRGHPAFPHERYPQTLPFANNPAGCGYLVTGDPDYQHKLERIEKRKSAKSRREHEAGKGEYRRGLPQSVVAGTRLLHKRLQQQRRTDHTLKHRQQQPHVAARIKTSFLPFTSCGLASRKPDSLRTNEFGGSLEGRISANSRKHQPVLKFNKS